MTRKQGIRYEFYILYIGMLICSFIACSSCKPKEEEKDMNEKVYAQIEFSNQDKVNLELFYDKAPQSVENFIRLAESDFYCGTVFHRIIPNFMIQIGGYYLEGNQLCSKPEIDAIPGEFKSNGWEKNDIHHELGVISMARTSDPNSATSQFFLCSAECSWLDNEYAAFGKTTDEQSNQVILKISGMPTCNIGGGFTDFPYEPISIVKVRIQNEKF